MGHIDWPLRAPGASSPSGEKAGCMPHFLLHFPHDSLPETNDWEYKGPFSKWQRMPLMTEQMQHC